jgi:hypothetical protein
VILALEASENYRTNAVTRWFYCNFMGAVLEQLFIPVDIV